MTYNRPDIVAILRDEYSDWVQKLSDEERRAIRKYSRNSFDSKTNRFFERLNAMLRGSYNQDDTEMLKKYSDIISGALSKHKLLITIECYRGLDVDPTSGLTEGTVFSFDQFISTSVIRSKALKRKFLFVITAPPGTVGAYIEKVSAYPTQREFLLDKSCNFRLIRKMGPNIYLEVVT